MKCHKYFLILALLNMPVAERTYGSEGQDSYEWTLVGGKLMYLPTEVKEQTKSQQSPKKTTPADKMSETYKNHHRKWVIQDGKVRQLGKDDLPQQVNTGPALDTPFPKEVFIDKEEDRAKPLIFADGDIRALIFNDQGSIERKLKVQRPFSYDKQLAQSSSAKPKLTTEEMKYEVTGFKARKARLDKLKAKLKRMEEDILKESIPTREDLVEYQNLAIFYKKELENYNSSATAYNKDAEKLNAAKKKKTSKSSKKK
ncbi:MAG: hypothetical protein HQL32_01610 [Planctomycetes bacterium]|nr:hypothetical protein [Planctomycetota bacterium]